MIKVKFHESVEQVCSKSWRGLGVKGNPFADPGFYEALEGSKCLGSQRGWRPQYVCAYEAEDLRALAVVFIKTDSFGEFIFDWAWAQAYQQYGLSYYPKLTLASPFSPVSAPKVLGDPQILRDYLLPKIWEMYQNVDVSSLHALFVPMDERAMFKNLGMIERDSFQYHWKRGEFKDFEDFLTALKRSRRKNILKERQRVHSAGVSIKKIWGHEIQKQEIDFFYKCYLNTIEKKWSQAYLTREFFEQLIQNLGDKTVLLMAQKNGAYIASALYLFSEETLYGRYWGATEFVDGLHFELCLYSGIELAFELGLETFEAGAQGEHKRMRGFVPVVTKSFHHLKSPEFMVAVENFVESEKQQISSLFQAFEVSSGFKDRN